MYRVPGETLVALPEDAVKRFVDMLEKLNNAKIMHGDLSSENMLWDAESKAFYPVDISNIREMYFHTDLEGKTYMNEFGQSEWDDIIEKIEERMMI